MFKVKVKDILVPVSIVVLAVATAVIAISEMSKIGTITGLTLIPALIALVGFGSAAIVRDIKSFKEIYEAADDE